MEEKGSFLLPPNTLKRTKVCDKDLGVRVDDDRRCVR